MNNPKELYYSESHEWVKKVSEGVVEIGITDYAQDQLGDIVFVNLPEEGAQFETGEVMTDIESVKAVSDVMCPIAGTIMEVNEELEDTPEFINNEPYSAWIARIKDYDEEEVEKLLNAEQYEAICK